MDRILEWPDILTTILSPSWIYEEDGFKNTIGFSGFGTLDVFKIALEKKN